MRLLDYVRGENVNIKTVLYGSITFQDSEAISEKADGSLGSDPVIVPGLDHAGGSLRFAFCRNRRLEFMETDDRALSPSLFSIAIVEPIPALLVS